MVVTDQIRRVVTGHDGTGKAIVVTDGPSPHKIVRPDVGTVNRQMWMTDRTPADISGSADPAVAHQGIPPPTAGTVFRIIDFPPTTDAEIAKLDPDFLSKVIPHGSHVPSKYRPASHPFMHRTRSIDYALVLAGEIDMKLDEEEIHLKAGDILIQQGTNHAWINRSGKTCRIAFILIDAAEPF